MNRPPLGRHHVDAALAAAADARIAASERAAMLVDIATSLHRQALSAQTLTWAAELYRHALALLSPEQRRERASAAARAAAAEVMAGACGIATLQAARATLTQASADLDAVGDRLEAAHCDMNLGIVAQQLAAAGVGPPGEAVAAYQRALRVYGKTAHPCEYAVIQSNLAAIHLQRVPCTPLHQQLALAALDSAMTAIDRRRHPREWGMVHNNLGNALQSIASADPRHDLQRALAAYDEALRVRTCEDAPLDHAATLANKAACLARLAEDALARDLYQQAAQVFAAAGDAARHDLLRGVIEDMDRAAA